jgi:hypothetical protein
MLIDCPHVERRVVEANLVRPIEASSRIASSSDEWVRMTAGRSWVKHRCVLPFTIVIIDTRFPVFERIRRASVERKHSGTLRGLGGTLTL